MKKLIDKRIIKTLVIVFVLGFIGGILFLILTNKLDKLIIKNEIEEYFNLFKDNKIIGLDNLINSFKNNITYITIILVSNIVFVLCPLTYFVNFYKGFLIGFLMSSIILTFKFKGIFYSLLVLIPHQLLMNLLIIIYSSIMIKFAFKLFNAYKNKENINIRLFTEKILILFMGALFITLISSLLEIYLNSIIMRLVI